MAKASPASAPGLFSLQDGELTVGGGKGKATQLTGVLGNVRLTPFAAAFDPDTSDAPRDMVKRAAPAATDHIHGPRGTGPCPSPSTRTRRRCRGSGDCTDGEFGRHQRCRVAAGSSADHRGDGTGDYVEDGSDTYGGLDVDEDTDYYDGEDGDYIDDGGVACIYYDSDDEKNFDAQTEEAEKKGKDDDPTRERKQRYVILTEDGVRSRQEADTAMVADVLSIPPGIAAVLLRHFKWGADQIQEKWFSDERRIRGAVGLPADDGVPVPMAANVVDLVCGICFEGHPADRMRSAACAAHFYCRACWRGYLHAAVEDGGPRCLSLRCPETSCPAPVARELVDAVAGCGDRARYAAFALRSYVEDSGGRIKWCPGRGCSRAVEFVGCADDASDVLCACGHGFCFRCGEEAHRPVSCETVRAWVAKNASDSENANWVLAHTKHCPKCRQPIEKNQGCNHMRCRCGYHFCWLCLEQAGGGFHYSCEGRPGEVDKDRAAVVAETEEQKRRQAKASLDRYLYHYERWAANLASLQMALADMDKLQRSGLEEMAAAVGCEVTDLDFLKEAYEQVADCRRVLRWSYAYGYFLDPERDVKKRELFEHLLNDANNALERLHGCAELERKELCAAASCDDSSSCDDGADVVAKKKKFVAYRERLAHLTRVTRHYFENLVKAFETDLPEIFAAKV